MKTLKDYNFDLPQELIAQHPIAGKRDESRLMILNRLTGAIEHKHFFDILDRLHAGDVLVMNNSKVLPARLIGMRADTEASIEILLVRDCSATHEGKVVWEAMIRWKKPKPKQSFSIYDKENAVVLTGHLLEACADTTWLVVFDVEPNAFMNIVEKIGHTPIPPYMDKNAMSESELRNQYQTVFAKHEGSVAAPTAGLHFTPELLEKIKEKEVSIVEITLHVGLGTFLPMKTENIDEHVMHGEYASISKSAAEAINTAKQEGRRIIAVGTTTVRTLESFAVPATENKAAHVEHGTKETRIFITPGYEFHAIDSLITNFHLPKSTLLLLVSAFAGRDHVLNAYHNAIEEHYRFFSFGDAMYIE